MFKPHRGLNGHIPANWAVVIVTAANAKVECRGFYQIHETRVAVAEGAHGGLHVVLTALIVGRQVILGDV